MEKDILFKVTGTCETELQSKFQPGLYREILSQKSQNRQTKKQSYRNKMLRNTFSFSVFRPSSSYFRG